MFKMMKRLTLLAAGAVAMATLAGAASADLVKYTVVDGSSIPDSLTGKTGDPKAGEKVFVNRKQGNCLACHTLSKLSEQPFHGEIAPPLDGVADRYTEGELRLRVVNPKVVNEATIMPAFYRDEGFHRVADEFKGKPILTAEQVEDLVAYLVTLKE
jgi:L-cysteine S-thiosulfotransferase